MDLYRSRSSHELCAVADQHKRDAREHSQRESDLNVQIETLRKQQEDIARQREESERQARASFEAAQKQLFAEQREERQKFCKNSLNEHIFRGIRQTADKDDNLLRAMQTIANDQGDKVDYLILRAAVLGEITGCDKSFLDDIARKIVSLDSAEDNRIVEQYRLSRVTAQEVPTGSGRSNEGCLTDASMRKPSVDKVNNEQSEARASHPGARTIKETMLSSSSEAQLIQADSGPTRKTLARSPYSETTSRRGSIAAVSDCTTAVSDLHSMDNCIPVKPEIVPRGPLDIQVERLSTPTQHFGTMSSPESRSVRSHSARILAEDGMEAASKAPSQHDCTGTDSQTQPISPAQGQKRDRSVDTVDLKRRLRVCMPQPSKPYILSTLASHISTLSSQPLLATTHLQCARCHKIPIRAMLNSCTHVYCIDCLAYWRKRARRASRPRAMCLESTCGSTLDPKTYGIKDDDWEELKILASGKTASEIEGEEEKEAGSTHGDDGKADKE